MEWSGVALISAAGWLCYPPAGVALLGAYLLGASVIAQVTGDE
jgi:hypothetical protein